MHKRHPYRDDFGVALMALRYERGLTLRELAEAMGSGSSSTLARWESDAGGNQQRRPSPQMFKKLCEALKIDSRQLLQSPRYKD